MNYGSSGDRQGDSVAVSFPTGISLVFLRESGQHNSNNMIIITLSLNKALFPLTCSKALNLLISHRHANHATWVASLREASFAAPDDT